MCRLVLEGQSSREGGRSWLSLLRLLCSLVEVQLITGRTHQIRIHLSATGHPVMGDSKYGDFEWNKEVKKKFHLNHQFLHAYQLTFVDPIGSMSYLKGKTVTSQLPEQLEKIQKELFS